VDLTKAGDELAGLRNLVTLGGPPGQVEAQRERAVEAVRSVLSVRGAKPGFWARVVGFDPSMLYFILQIALLILEFIKQRQKPPVA
jgi:hypothetical protein